MFDAPSRTVNLRLTGLNGRGPPRNQAKKCGPRHGTEPVDGRSGNVARGISHGKCRGRWSSRTSRWTQLPKLRPEGRTKNRSTDLELRRRALLNWPSRRLSPFLDIRTPRAGQQPHGVCRACCAKSRLPCVRTASRSLRCPRSGTGPHATRRARAGFRRPFSRRRPTLICNKRLCPSTSATYLRVVGPIYVTVRAAAKLRLAKGAGASAVIERARLALDRFLAGRISTNLSANTSGIGQSQSPVQRSGHSDAPCFHPRCNAVLDGVPVSTPSSGSC
jgi:hypothetical protein